MSKCSTSINYTQHIDTQDSYNYNDPCFNLSSIRLNLEEVINIVPNERLFSINSTNIVTLAVNKLHTLGTSNVFLALPNKAEQLKTRIMFIRRSESRKPSTWIPIESFSWKNHDHLALHKTVTTSDVSKASHLVNVTHPSSSVQLWYH